MCYTVSYATSLMLRLFPFHAIHSITRHLPGAAFIFCCLCFQVFTSDIKGAGTDANVTIIMFGSNGLNTGKVKLDSSKNNFERGTVRVGDR